MKKSKIVLSCIVLFTTSLVLILELGLYKPARILFIHGLSDNEALLVTRYYNSATRKYRYYLKRINGNGQKIWSRKLALEPPASFLNGDPPRMALIDHFIIINGKIQEKHPDRYFGGKTNITMAYDLETGKKIWETAPLIWPQDIGSCTIPFKDCFVNVYWDKDEGTLYQAFDVETGALLATLEDYPIDDQFHFNADFMVTYQNHETLLLAPRTMNVHHRFEASPLFMNQGNTFYYMPKGTGRIVSLNTDNSREETLLDIDLLNGDFYLFNDIFSLGIYQNRRISFLKLGGAFQKQYIEQNGILYYTFPEWIFRHMFRREYFYARNYPQYHPFWGELTPYIPVFTEYWDSPEDIFLGFINVEQGNVASVSSTGPEHSLDVSPIIRYENKYYCIWDRGLEDSWLMIFDGLTGKIARVYALNYDYAKISSYSFSGDSLWIHKEFGYGYIILNIKTEDIVFSSEKDENITDITEEAQDFFYGE